MKDPDDLIQVVKLEPNGLGNPMIFRLDTPVAWRKVFEELQCLLLNGEDGDRVSVTRERMRAGDLALLPAHQGW